MESFTKILHWCENRGRMTTADLARWFDRDYHTVAGWVQRSRQPSGPRLPQVLDDVMQLQAAIKTQCGFPIPVDLSPRDRAAYVTRLREEIGGYDRVSANGAAAKRMAGRAGAQGRTKKAKRLPKGGRADRVAASARRPRV